MADGPTCWKDATDDVPLKLSDDEASFKPEVAPARYIFTYFDYEIRNFVLFFFVLTASSEILKVLLCA